MIAGVFVLYISSIYYIYFPFSLYSNTFAKYLYFHSNTFIKMYLYSVFVKLRSICVCIRILLIVFGPRFGVNGDEEICELIDKFVTTSQPDIDDPIFELVNLQIRRHSHTCNKKVKEYRFGYPKPPMRKTTILQPLPTDELTRKQIETYRKQLTYVCSYL